MLVHASVMRLAHYPLKGLIELAPTQKPTQQRYTLM